MLLSLVSQIMPQVDVKFKNFIDLRFYSFVIIATKISIYYLGVMFYKILNLSTAKNFDYFLI